MGTDERVSFKASGDELTTTEQTTWNTAIGEARRKWRRVNVEPKGQVYFLASVEVLTPEGRPDPEQGQWMGDHPTGQLIDLPAGYYALQVMRNPPAMPTPRPF